MARMLARSLSTRRTTLMLAELAECISALGPRFQLPFQVLRTIEAQDGRKAALAFARA